MKSSFSACPFDQISILIVQLFELLSIAFQSIAVKENTCQEFGNIALQC